ncbi:MAG: hypothetical protein HOV83_38080, partial [Catenulispora sp.]|nr:hypothetical protein [Catenulispora sp.]
METANRGAFRKTSTWDPVTVSAALHHCRRYLVTLISSRPDDCALPVAAAGHGPDVFSLVCHLAENSRLAESNLAGPVPKLSRRLRDLSVPDLLREWERSGGVVEDSLRGRRGLAGSVLMTDLYVHELDIRRAYGSEEPEC